MKLGVSDWLRTGKLGPIGEGTPREEVRALLGAPGDWHADSEPDSSLCWRYGPFELGFAPESVSYVRVDTVNLVHGADGGPIRMEWEGIRDRKPLAECSAWLASRRFDFDVLFERDGASIYLQHAFIAFAGESDLGVVHICSPGASATLRASRR